MVSFEKVDVLNVTNGNRISTYVIPGVRGSGKICINGAAARLVKVRRNAFRLLPVARALLPVAVSLVQFQNQVDFKIRLNNLTPNMTRENG